MAARTPFPRAITTPCMLPPHNQRRQKENRFDSGAIDRGPHLVDHRRKTGPLGC
ncbi:hypothetical protein Plhal703r1_c13g0066681 [Plasmopara halstedii]